MTPRKWVTIAVSSLLLVATLVVGPSLAHAQEGGAIRFQTTAGGYEISVEEFASGLSLGSAQVLVTLRDAATGQGVGDARVVVRVKHDLNDEEGWVTALNSPNNPERYRARMSLTAPGTWRLWVEVDGPLGRVEVEILPLDVPALSSYSTGSFIFIGVFLILVLGSTYLWWSSRKALRRRGTPHGLPDESGRDTGPGQGETGL